MPVTGNNYSLSKVLKSVANGISTKHLLIAIIIFSFFGFLDATYLTILHYRNVMPPCTVGGCESVLTSSYSTLFGIPIALFGSSFYVVLILLAGSLLTFNFSQQIQSHLRLTLYTLTGIGLVLALVLVGIQAFILHQYCLYCLTSEVIDFLLFDCCFWLYRKK